MKIVDKKDNLHLFPLMALAIFIFFVGMTLSGEEGLIRLYQLKNAKAELVSENKDLMLQNLYLAMEQKRLRKMEAIGFLAHESLGWLAENETLFIFEKPSVQSLVAK